MSKLTDDFLSDVTAFVATLQSATSRHHEDTSTWLTTRSMTTNFSPLDWDEGRKREAQQQKFSLRLVDKNTKTSLLND